MAPQQKPAAKKASTTGVKTGRVAKSSSQAAQVVAAPPTIAPRRSSRIAAARAAALETVAQVAEVVVPVVAPRRGRSKKAASNNTPDAEPANAPAAVPKRGRTKKAAAATTTTTTPTVNHTNAPAAVTRMTRSRTLAARSAQGAAPAAPAAAKRAKAPISKSTGGVTKSKAATKATKGPKPSVASKARGNKTTTASASKQIARDKEQTPAEREDVVMEDVPEPVVDNNEDDLEPGTPNPTSVNLPDGSDSEAETTAPAPKGPSAKALGKRPQNPFWSVGEGPLVKRIRLDRKILRPPKVQKFADGPMIPDHVPSRCAHPIHPAYAGTSRYDNVKCPHCRMDVCISDMQTVQDQLSSYGGSVGFRKLCNSSEAHAMAYQPIVKGRTPRRTNDWVLQDPVGKDLSYRHSTKRLANLVMELERLADVEMQWEGQHPGGSAEDKHERHLYGARGALARHRGLLAEGSFSRLLELDLVGSRKRGRAQEAEALDAANAKEVAWEQENLSSQEYAVNDSRVSSVEETARLAAERSKQPMRKRRRMDATVSFKNVVYVRNECDVDVLRKADLSRPVVEPSASILRTAPAPAPAPNERRSVSTAQLAPDYRLFVLEDEKFSAKDRHSFHSCNRERTQPGNFWSRLSDPGKMIVETSGCGMGPQSWDAYVQSLQDEADWRDAEDAQDADLQDQEHGESGSDTESEPSDEDSTLSFLHASVHEDSLVHTQRGVVNQLTGLEIDDPESYLRVEEERLARQRKCRTPV
ncbi:hypothetical protein IAQ61_001203 [Plenodomus lingam]|uniref:uncharacterized protein n=1 Tax=Leptosphaeria maculans TaxID=5022 RepID=UPI0033283244|nr:hypothetical protein IAQ61_001203 [Plenodomus lingam]